MNDASPTRVFLRPLGIPLPLGLGGLAVASFIDSGLELHWVPDSQALEVGLILIAVPFTVELLACVLSYLARDGAAGATLGILASTWLAIGLLHVASPARQTSNSMGLLLLASGAVIAISACAVAAAKPLPALVFLLAAARFGLAGIYQLSAASGWGHASGILGLSVTGLAGYCVLAFELEGQERSTVLPTFRRGRGKSALLDGLPAQVAQIEHEAGVRQTT